jgi:hypothetical protein
VLCEVLRHCEGVYMLKIQLELNDVPSQADLPWLPDGVISLEGESSRAILAVLSEQFDVPFEVLRDRLGLAPTPHQ